MTTEYADAKSQNSYSMKNQKQKKKTFGASELSARREYVLAARCRPLTNCFPTHTHTNFEKIAFHMIKFTKFRATIVTSGASSIFAKWRAKCDSQSNTIYQSSFWFRNRNFSWYFKIICTLFSLPHTLSSVCWFYCHLNHRFSHYWYTVLRKFPRFFGNTTKILIKWLMIYSAEHRICLCSIQGMRHCIIKWYVQDCADPNHG